MYSERPWSGGESWLRLGPGQLRWTGRRARRDYRGRCDYRGRRDYRARRDHRAAVTTAPAVTNRDWAVASVTWLGISWLVSRDLFHPYIRGDEFQ